MQCQIVKLDGRCKNQALDTLVIELENGVHKVISICNECDKRFCWLCAEEHSPDELFIDVSNHA